MIFLAYSSRYQVCTGVESKHKRWSVIGFKDLLDLMSVECMSMQGT
jgi:hypothetical protein